MSSSIRLAAVTEAARLHGCDLQTTAKLVDDNGGQSFIFVAPYRMFVAGIAITARTRLPLRAT